MIAYFKHILNMVYFYVRFCMLESTTFHLSLTCLHFHELRKRATYDIFYYINSLTCIKYLVTFTLQFQLQRFSGSVSPVIYHLCCVFKDISYSLSFPKFIPQVCMRCQNQFKTQSTVHDFLHVSSRSSAVIYYRCL